MQSLQSLFSRLQTAASRSAGSTPARQGSQPQLLSLHEVRLVSGGLPRVSCEPAGRASANVIEEPLPRVS